MSTFRKLFCILSLVAQGLSSTSALGVDCRSYFSNHLQKNVQYCVDRTDAKSTQREEPTVFFFHGMNGSAKSYIDNGYAEKLTSLSHTKSLPKMTIISFDTDQFSFFSDRAGNTTGSNSYESWFISEFIPFTEKELPWTCRTRICRGTMGLSMGGFGALKIALKHQDQFAIAAANCPALAPFGLYESVNDWNSFFSRHGIGSFKGMILLQQIRGIFTSPAQADANDPSYLIENEPVTASMPELYFDMGGKDYFGFHEGYNRFKKALDNKGIAYESFFDPNEGHEIFKKTGRNSLEFLIRYFEKK